MCVCVHKLNKIFSKLISDRNKIYSYVSLISVHFDVHYLNKRPKNTCTLFYIWLYSFAVCCIVYTIREFHVIIHEKKEYVLRICFIRTV